MNFLEFDKSFLNEKTISVQNNRNAHENLSFSILGIVQSK